MRELYCPFCGGALKRNKDSLLECTTCKFIVDDSLKIARFSHNAPEHLKESAKFVDLCNITKPKYCLSPKHLWQPGFESSRVIMCGVDMNNYVNNVQGGYAYDSFDFTLPSESNKGCVSSGYVLVAARGCYAFDMKYLFLEAYSNDSEFDMSDHVYCDTSYYLYWMFRMYNEYKDCNTSVIREMNAFYAPNMETMLCYKRILEHPKGDLYDLNGEQMLYSFAVPMANMRFGEIKIKDYFEEQFNAIKRGPCLSMLESGASHFAKVLDTVGVPLVDKKGLLYDFMMHEPYRAVNCCTNATITYDVRDGKTHIYPEDVDITSSKSFYPIAWVYHTLWQLFIKYAGYSRIFGLEYKEKAVGRRMGAIDTVIEFWRKVAGEL